jgi:hypothetical protein
LGSGETFSQGREAGLKRIPAINDPNQTTGFDHGGIHPHAIYRQFLRSSLSGMSKLSPLR